MIRPMSNKALEAVHVVDPRAGVASPPVEVETTTRRRRVKTSGHFLRLAQWLAGGTKEKKMRTLPPDALHRRGATSVRQRHDCFKDDDGTPLMSERAAGANDRRCKEGLTSPGGRPAEGGRPSKAVAEGFAKKTRCA
ncbi:hypothetical protein MRX96_035477 [Rhipicephalus microplus]